METNYEKKYYDVEKNYWIFKGYRKLILDTMKKYKLQKDVNILEVGCSTGNLIEIIKKKHKNIIGVEKSDLAIKNLSLKKITCLQTSDYNLTGILDNSQDLLIASNVLEHIKDHNLAIKEWERVLKKKGKAIIIVPAFKLLWSNHDVINLHYRRYSKNSLNLLIKNNTKLKIKNISYWNSTLFLPVFLIRLLSRPFEKRTKKTGVELIQPLPNFINNFLFKLLNFETFLINNGIKMPFGISLIVEVEKV